MQFNPDLLDTFTIDELIADGSQVANAYLFCLTNDIKWYEAGIDDKTGYAHQTAAEKYYELCDYGNMLLAFDAAAKVSYRPTKDQLDFRETIEELDWDISNKLVKQFNCPLSILMKSYIYDDDICEPLTEFCRMVYKRGYNDKFDDALLLAFECYTDKEYKEAIDLALEFFDELKKPLAEFFYETEYDDIDYDNTLAEEIYERILLCGDNEVIREYLRHPRAAEITAKNYQELQHYKYAPSSEKVKEIEVEFYEKCKK